MSYQLFLDDLRTIQMVYPDKSSADFVIVRTYHEFVDTVLQNGLPDFISFDNDLGCDESGIPLLEGYDAVKWLVYESGLDLSNLSFKVHSSNPVAKVNIEALLNNYIRFLKNT